MAGRRRAPGDTSGSSLASCGKAVEASAAADALEAVPRAEAGVEDCAAAEGALLHRRGEDGRIAATGLQGPRLGGDDADHDATHLVLLISLCFVCGQVRERGEAGSRRRPKFK